MGPLAADLGVEYSDALCIKTDATAAIGISHRVGAGKIRHIKVSQLWLQGMVTQGKVVIQKVPTEETKVDGRHPYMSRLAEPVERGQVIR